MTNTEILENNIDMNFKEESVYALKSQKWGNAMKALILEVLRM